MSSLTEKAKSIRLLILDVDGVLTNGKIYYGPNDIELKAFHIHDGLGLKLLQKAGIEIAIISGKHSAAVEKRMMELKIKYVYLGHNDKLPIYETLKQNTQMKDEQIAYIGDDLPDLPILKRAGFSATVPNAPAIISQHIDFITNNLGGQGAVREVCDLILKAQNQYENVIESYLV